LNENPPSSVRIERVVRNILAEQPRITRFPGASRARPALRLTAHCSLAPEVDFDGYQAEEAPVELQAEEDVEGMLMAEDEGAAAEEEVAKAE